MKPPIGPVLDHYHWDSTVRGYGAWGNTRCPFHEDRTPSARVNEDEGIFHCFVCEISGDAYDLVMKAEGVDFLRAKELIREWTGFDESGSAPNSGSGAGSQGYSLAARPQKLVNSKLPAWVKAKHSRKLV